MRRGGLFPSAFLNTVFFLVTGTLKNGERCVDAASLGLQPLGQLQIDEPSNQERSNLLTGSQARGYPGYESGVHNMRGIVPRTNVDFQSASQLELSSGGDNSKTVEGSTHRTRPVQVDLTGDAGRHLLKPKQNSATNFRVEVTLGEEMKKGNRSIEDAMMRLKEALAELYPWQEENIEVVKINFKTRQVDLLFFDPAMGRANTITKHAHLLKDLQIAVPELKIQKVEICDKLTDRDGVTLAVYQAPFWMRDYFPYIMTGGCILIVVILSLTTYACFCRAKDNVPITSATNGLGSQHIYQQQQPQQQHVLFPDVVAPDTGSPLAIQPCAAPVFVPVGYVTTPVPAQPIRVKRKGLLESRRGSNASLTLDLQPSPEIGRWDGTPPKESSGLEYLMSAGNRLSRRDLRNAAKNTKILYEEFWEIPMNHPEKVSVAGSGMKNRYKTIIPNEHTRVVLPDADQDPLSSYINANYIRGYEGEMHAYVATQGPMAHTIEDFWLMVWHLYCPIIVMITKLKEKSKPKCENYLPEHYGIYGDIEVTVTKIIQKKGFVVRHLHLKYDGESRMLLHFWYTAWPDHKPPDSPSMLLELVKEVELRRYRTDGVTPRGPVVVHCSAGIGRTGCFVAISIGIRQLREEHSVDVLGIVCGMRLDRGGMIQTHEQYDFVHQALCEYERTLGEPSIQSLTALTSEGH